MSRRSAGDSLPLGIKILALIVPIILAGGYIAYQHHKQGMRELASSKNLRLVSGAQQYMLDSAQADQEGLGLATDTGNIGSQGADYQEQMLELATRQNVLPQLDSMESINEAANPQLMHSSKSLRLVDPSDTKLFSSSKSGVVFEVTPPKAEGVEPETEAEEATAE